MEIILDFLKIKLSMKQQSTQKCNLVLKTFAIRKTAYIVKFVSKIYLLTMDIIDHSQLPNFKYRVIVKLTSVVCITQKRKID